MTRRKTPVESLLPKAIYLHYLDNTEGIPDNRPLLCFSTTKKNPFGTPGLDYSKTYPWRYIRMVPEAKGKS